MSMTGDDFDLSAALEAELDGTAHETPAQAEQREETPGREYDRDEGGRFKAKEQLEEEIAPVVDTQPQQAPVQAKPAWRPTWYKDEYGPWDALGEPFRNALRDQERNASQAIEKHSTAAKSWEPISKALEPFAQQLAASGSSGPQYVGQLIEADKYLRANPVQALDWLCQQYTGGYDLRQLVEWMNQESVQTQRVDPLQQQVMQLQQQIQHLQQIPVQQQREGLNKQIADWSRDKPDFPAVRQLMAALAKGNPEASLDQLYEQACRAHPETWERIQAEREDKRIKELQGKRQMGAQSPRGGQPNGAIRAPKMSLEEEIANAIDGAA